MSKTIYTFRSDECGDSTNPEAADTPIKPATFYVSFDFGGRPDQVLAEQKSRQILRARVPTPAEVLEGILRREEDARRLKAERQAQLRALQAKRQRYLDGRLSFSDICAGAAEVPAHFRIKHLQPGALLALVKTRPRAAPVGCLLEVRDIGQYDELFATPDLNQHIGADLHPSGIPNYTALWELLNQALGFKVLLVAPGEAVAAPAQAAESEVWFVTPPGHTRGAGRLRRGRAVRLRGRAVKILHVLGDTTIAGRRVFDIVLPVGERLRLGDTIETGLGCFKVVGLSTTHLPGADIAVVVEEV